VQPLEGRLVVDLTRLLPGPFASSELLRLGARVVRIEPPAGDPLREAMPRWHDVLNAGKESVVCDLQADPALANALCARADVVLEGFRPGVADALGLVVPASAVYCSITGFGAEGPRAGQAGHDVNYLGYAGVLADTAPALPPIQVADLAAGGLGAVVEILAALVRGGGARIVVSMTHAAYRFVAHRGGDDTLLTGGSPLYRIYETADGRHLTVGALEPKFAARLLELLGGPDPGELAAIFRTRTLADWTRLFDGEDVCVGPVNTVREASAEFGAPPTGPAPALGAHTEAWRRLLQR
jgi:crotonobetainyl-CoA:carnitine CoA-transferase CaiB-like acyl-CoA transferase